MNQAASATTRPPAGSTSTTSCCPMLSPFFINTFVPQVPPIPPTSTQQCFLGFPSSQTQPLGSIQPSNHQQPATLQTRQQNAVSQHPIVNAQSDRSYQSQRYQDRNVSLDNIGNNYNTSLAAQTLNVHRLLLANRPSADYVALAAAAAAAAIATSANLTQHPSQHQSHHNHHQPDTSATSTTEAINTIQPTTSSTSSASNVSTVSSSSTSTSSASVTNQVPILNFSSYNTAPQNLNINAQNAPQPPVAAHLNHTSNQHQQQSSLSGLDQIIGNLNSSNRPLAFNNIFENIENQQQQSATTYRRQPPVAQNGRTQLLSGTHPAQPSTGPVTRNALIEDTFNALENTFLLQQIANNPYLGPLNIAPLQQQHSNQTQQQQSSQHAAQHPSGSQHTSSRSQYTLPNQVPPTPVQQAQIPLPELRSEQVSNQNQAQHHQQQFQQATRLAQVSAPLNDVTSSAGDGYHQAHQTSLQVNNESVSQNSQSDSNVPAPSEPTLGQTSAQQSQQLQQPHMTTINFPNPQQQQQLLTILTNNALLFQYLNSLHYQGNALRSEQHPIPNPSHHFLPNLQGAHHAHPHHHGANGQVNGQDPTIPVDSLAISESKPKGLNRAEIDSLTHYIHTDEKDSRTCVICLSRFELKSKIRPLSCNHAFHAKCVDKWLRANRTCPICRRDALKTHEGKIKRV